jgi:glycosyltransferase involved in cell wall biosynthesis
VPELLAALDVFVQPSLREGLSISLIEALAAGKPIVASSIPSNGEVIAHEKSGLLVPPADPAALAQALKRLLRDPAFAQALGENAQQDSKVRFSRERMVEEVLARYDRVSAAGHPSACHESV